MEHAVPQNVTSFEFHLVGDMTLKQFGYLAAGAIIAYAAVVLLLPVSPLLAIPTIALFGMGGAAFAFLPIADRPLDHWLRSYLKAVYSPTKAAWKSASVKTQDPMFYNRLQVYLSSMGVAPATPSPATPAQKPQLSRFIPASQPVSNPEGQQTNTPVETPSPDTAKLVEINRYIQTLQAKIFDLERQVQRPNLPTPFAPPAPTTNIPQPSPAAAAPEVKKPEVRVVAPSAPQKTQILLTTFPNIINGIVTDTAGNYLEGVIVSIHDKNNLPVRALKTNKLGQFAGATPLPTGVYTVSLEKDGLEFDTLEVTLNNEVLSPLMVSAKKGGVIS